MSYTSGRDENMEQHKADLLDEIEVMKQLGKHQNIVSLIGASTKKEPVLLVMEYMPYGNLQAFLR